jgi:UDP-glucose 4-epimerase
LFDLARLFDQDYTIIEKRKGDRMKGANSTLKKDIEDTKIKLNWQPMYNLEDWIESKINVKRK